MLVGWRNHRKEKLQSVALEELWAPRLRRHTLPSKFTSLLRKLGLGQLACVFSALVMTCSNICNPHHPMIRYCYCPHFIREIPERLDNCLRQHSKQSEGWDLNVGYLYP